MPKKPPKNGFFYYMLDYKIKSEKNGITFPGGLNEVAKQCSEHWQKLDPMVKNNYNERAKREPAGSTKSNPHERYTSQGLPFSFLDKSVKLESDKMKKKTKTIEQIIDIAIIEKDLESQVFHFISFNYFCKPREGAYVPAEVGLVKYSLKSGIIDSHHMLINPVTLPLGQKFVAKQHADETHRLPVPPEAKGEVSYKKVYQSILDFCYNYDKDEMMPLFTADTQIHIVQDILNVLESEGVDETGAESEINVLSLRQLFFNFKRGTAHLSQNSTSTPFQSIHVAQAHIERDPYEYRLGIACEFHDELDRSSFCSLSQVKRWAFMFSDHCCVDLNIDTIPGKHVPIESLIPKYESDCSVSECDSIGPSSNASTTKFLLTNMGGYAGVYRNKFKAASEMTLLNSSRSSQVPSNSVGSNLATPANTDDESSVMAPEDKLNIKHLVNNPINTSNPWRSHIPLNMNDTVPSESDFYSFISNERR